LENRGITLNAVCCIYSTAPLLYLGYFKTIFKIFNDGNWEYVFSATQYDYPIARSFKILDNHGLKMVAPENTNKRSQDLAPVFHDAGHFYWGTKESWVQDRPIFSEKSTIVDLSSYMVVDIDTEDDWVRAELMFKLLKEK